jgi:hypothetical protein
MARIFQVTYYDQSTSLHHNYFIESIIKCYKYIRKLAYDQDPDYSRLKYYVLRDLENNGLNISGIYDWSESVELL